MNDFKVQTEQFADIKILRYQVPGFADLPLKTKIFLYYLYEAALAGRDMIYDQNYKYNLLIRHTLENILETYTGDRNSPDWLNFVIYTKKVWFSNGIHHHYSMDKFVPDISAEFFEELILKSETAKFITGTDNIKTFVRKITPVIFDKSVDSKRVVQDQGLDIIRASANNFYENVTQKEAEQYYNSLSKTQIEEPPSFGLNTRLIKKDGRLIEQAWKVGGMYSESIEKIVFWLEKAIPVAENLLQKRHWKN